MGKLVENKLLAADAALRVKTVVTMLGNEAGSVGAARVSCQRLAEA